MTDYFGIAQTQLVIPTWATTFKRYLSNTDGKNILKQIY